MKKYISVIAILAFLAGLIGCSNKAANPVGLTVSKTAIMKMRFISGKPGELSKRAAFDTVPAYAIINSDTVFGPFSGNSVEKIYQLNRGQKYHFDVTIQNAQGKNLNFGYADTTVPDVDTFSLSIQGISMYERVNLEIPLDGTPVKNSAVSAALIWSRVTVGQPWADSVTMTFAAGSLSSIKLAGVIPINTIGTAFDLTVTILCNNGLYYTGSSGSITIMPSQNYTATIDLYKYGTATAAGKVTIVIDPRGEIKVGVNFLP